VRLEASTKPHVHQKFEIFWTNIASTMTCPMSKNGPKKGLRPLGVKVLFSERDAFSAHKTSLFISITSLIEMEGTKAFLVGMDLSNMVQFSFIF
jgi:hypothetical protein